MKIGIMLRHYEQHGGGVKVYTDNLLREISRMDSQHEFVFIYRDPNLIGTYSNGKNIREIAIHSWNKLTWDQYAVRSLEKKEKFDLIFNPKYSIPLTAKCPTVFINHGMPWYVMPWASKWHDRLSHKFLVPRYVEKVTAIIAVSNTARNHMIEYFKLDPDRTFTVYHGIDEVFREPISSQELEAIRRIHNLPDRYFIYVGQIYPPKNFRRLLQAYFRVGPQMGISLVVAGAALKILRGNDDIVLSQLGNSKWVNWLGWVEPSILAGLYAMSEALVFPSLYEAFGMPIIEAMATGCPVVTANCYSTKELAENAGILVDPENVDSIANGMVSVVQDSELRKKLIKNGCRRAKDFSWKRCATETIKILENVSKAQEI